MRHYQRSKPRKAYAEERMLHVADGESVAGTLRESGLPGEVIVEGDLLYEGPPRPASNLLPRYAGHEETILWFDHRLSNQLLLIRTLDWFSRQDLTGRKLSVVFAGRTILGGITADKLAALAPDRLPATAAHFDLACAAWTAFTSPDPTAIERVLSTETSALPFLAPALLRYLEDFPSTDDGLSRTQQQALTVLRERGALSKERLFFAVQRLEKTPFIGDQSFFDMLDGLASLREPLIQGSPAAITEAGLRVLEGRADRLHLNGIDAPWRWDRTRRRIASR
jgi:hypothetical protein